jgi:peptide/nickel transport system substrate-binding protein
MSHHFPEHVPQTLLFDSLTQLLPDGNVAPKLAEKWDVSADNLVYTFTLAGNAKFHDGSPVTADDVKFTFDTCNDPKSGSSNEGVDTVAAVEVVDQRTVKVTLKSVTPMFLAQGGARGIVPKRLLEGKEIANDGFNKNPVGSGPYKLVSYTPGQSIVMEAVPDYYGGAAAIKRIVFKILTDQNVILTQLRAGEINYALITPRDLTTVNGIASVAVLEAPTPRFFDITPNYARPYWQEQPVREAILTAIDRQGIVDKVLQGKGKVLDANVAPTSWAFNPDVAKHPFDIAKAKGLLDAAGWRPGGDGTREKGGQKLAFSTMANNYDRTLEQALLVAQQSLKEIGVAMQIERVEPGVFGSRRGKKEYDAPARIWNPVYDPDQTGLVKTGNFYGYSNPQVDTLSAQALATTDQAQRKAAYAQVQTLLASDVARLFLYTENELHALPRGLTGAGTHPVSIFWNIKDWQPGA